MKCDQIKYLLYEYIDDHVNDNQKKLIEEHLLGCLNCRSTLEDLKEYKKLVRQMQPAKAPVALEDNVFSTIQEKTISKQEFKMPGWLKIAAAAMIIGFLYLLTPDNYFKITKLELQYIPVEQKRSKGPAIIKKSEKGVDIRIQYLNKLVNAYGGKVISTKQKKAESNIEHLTVEIPRDEYIGFAAAFNARKPLYKLPEKLPFSFRKMVKIVVFFEKRRYLSGDINGDNYDDIVMYFSSGRYQNHWFVALNDKMGNFLKPVLVEMNDKKGILKKQYDAIIADINADTFDDLLLIQTEKDSSGVWYVFENDQNNGFKESKQVHFLHDSIIYISESLPFSGDFNNDGYDDIGLRTKHEWVIFINNTAGNFNHGQVIEIVTGAESVTGEYLTFSGDFNNDGFSDIGLKGYEHDNSGFWYISYNNQSLMFEQLKPLRFHERSGRYIGVKQVFPGDYNGDGYDDILAIYGDEITTGSCFISLNSQKDMIGLGYEVTFGGDHYFVTE